MFSIMYFWQIFCQRIGYLRSFIVSLSRDLTLVMNYNIYQVSHCSPSRPACRSKDLTPGTLKVNIAFSWTHMKEINEPITITCIRSLFIVEDISLFIYSCQPVVLGNFQKYFSETLALKVNFLSIHEAHSKVTEYILICVCIIFW